MYLKAELARNVNADVDALIENFMKAYFGEAAAPYMLQFLNAQQAHYGIYLQFYSHTCHPSFPFIIERLQKEYVS